jgi:invasion protein IalB
MVGVRGSIPLAPTISDKNSASCGAGSPPRAAGGRDDEETTAFMKAARLNGERTLRRFLSALAFVAASLAAAGAQAQGAIKDKHGDWETRCETPPGARDEQCAVVLSVVDQERPNLTLVVIVLNTADRKARLMRIIAPLGVLLPPGIGLKIDDQDMGRLNYLECLANGCIAQVAMDDKLLDKLKTGKTATLAVFQTPEQGIGVLAPLAGFKQAYEQLP